MIAARRCLRTSPTLVHATPAPSPIFTIHIDTELAQRASRYPAIDWNEWVSYALVVESLRLTTPYVERLGKLARSLKRRREKGLPPTAAQKREHAFLTKEMQKATADISS